MRPTWNKLRVNLDYNFKAPKGGFVRHRRKSPMRRWLLLACLVAGMFGIYFLLNEEIDYTPPEENAPIEQTTGSPQTPVPVETGPKREIVESAVKPGETISGLLGEYFSAQELHDLATQSKKVFPLSGLCAGQNYKLCVNDGRFERFEYDINRDFQLIITQDDNGFDISRIPIDYTVKTELVGGVIKSSLFETVSDIGEGPELAITLADTFAWDIDFLRDIRPGDSFQAVIEKRSREGESAGYGSILAASFTNQGRTYQAFLFKDGSRPAAFYDAKGNSLRKAFLKAPLAFSRVSSGFTMRRFHPISKTWKAHPAIDYAAPSGTPIKAVADGSIIKIGYTKFNGNHIKIRHVNGLESLYLHMNGFAKGMKSGKRLVQGQTIGYVGSTGLATGPHLCFRMTQNGAPINPNKIKTTSAEPVSAKRLGEFKTAVVSLQARLSGANNGQLTAKTEKNPTEVQRTRLDAAEESRQTN